MLSVREIRKRALTNNVKDLRKYEAEVRYKLTNMLHLFIRLGFTNKWAIDMDSECIQRLAINKMASDIKEICDGVY